MFGSRDALHLSLLASGEFQWVETSLLHIISSTRRLLRTEHVRWRSRRELSQVSRKPRKRRKGEESSKTLEETRAEAKKWVTYLAYYYYFLFKVPSTKLYILYWPVYYEQLQGVCVVFKVPIAAPIIGCCILTARAHGEAMVNGLACVCMQTPDHKLSAEVCLVPWVL